MTATREKRRVLCGACSAAVRGHLARATRVTPRGARLPPALALARYGGDWGVEAGRGLDPSRSRVGMGGLWTYNPLCDTHASDPKKGHPH